MRKLGSILTFLTGVAFLGMAILLSTGYVSITEMAALMSAELQLIVPALWLIFAFNLVVLGFILFVIALRPARGGPFIVFLAALGPASSAGLLARGIQFGGPVPLLLSISGLSLLAAALLAIQVRLKPKRKRVREPEPAESEQEPDLEPESGLMIDEDDV